jgi:hypothetical protein
MPEIQNQTLYIIVKLCGSTPRLQHEQVRRAGNPFGRAGIQENPRLQHSKSDIHATGFYWAFHDSQASRSPKTGLTKDQSLKDRPVFPIALEPSIRGSAWRIVQSTSSEPQTPIPTGLQTQRHSKCQQNPQQNRI